MCEFHIVEDTETNFEHANIVCTNMNNADDPPHFCCTAGTWHGYISHNLILSVDSFIITNFNFFVVQNGKR